MISYAIITFHNSHFAIKAKKILERTGRRSETIPVPRQFSSECGFCCKVLWEDRRETEEILRVCSVEYDSVHRWDKDEEAEQKKQFIFV